IDKQPEIKQLLEATVTRKKALERIQAISEAESAVSDEEVLARYNQLKNEILRPEAEGALIKVTTPVTSGTAEEARARETTRKLAEDIRTRLEGKSVDEVMTTLSAEEAAVTSMTRIAKHVIGQGTDQDINLFDQGATPLTNESKVGQ